MLSFERIRGHGYYGKQFCMICGLEGGRDQQGRDKWLKAIYCTATGEKVIESEEGRWYRSLKSSRGRRLIRNGTDVYLFHKSCWDQLLTHFGPSRLHLASLFEALERLPLPRGYKFPAHVTLPGRVSIDLWYGTQDDQHEFPILPGRFPLPELEELMRFAKDPPRPSSSIAQRPVNHVLDGFERLPSEIFEMIWCMLSAKEALDLRHVTRAAIPLFENSRFWKSRFAIDGERGFLLPVVEKYLTSGGNDVIDWRLLYHCTARLNCSDWFEIEIRSWETLRWLRDTAWALQHERPRPPDFRGSPALQHYHNTTRRNTFMETVDINSSLCKIAISALQEAGEVNITGMEFIFDDGRPSAVIGYSTPGAVQMPHQEYTRVRRCFFDRHTIWPCPGVRVTMNVVGLRGICYVKDANGIHGISIYHDGEKFDQLDESRCVGLGPSDDDQEQVAYSNSLDQVDKVIAVVDNRKMIDLGVSGKATKRCKYTKDEWDQNLDHFRTV